MQGDWNEFETTLGLKFHSKDLLNQAFTHASYRNEHKKVANQDNERLEFLGDAVLELVVSEALYLAHPTLPEGELTRMRASIVCEPSLVKFATRLSFHRYIRLGRGEERSGGRNRPALLADVFEAFVGALYLDLGWDAAKAFVHEHVLDEWSRSEAAQDFKTRLQEYVQQHLLGELKYVVVDERGPAHEREFVVDVFLRGEWKGRGDGRTKKEAEQQAAQVALRDLDVQAGRGN